jgi:hypothetical protein
MRAHKTREPEQHAQEIPSSAIRLLVYSLLWSRATLSLRSMLRQPILHAMYDVVEGHLQRVRDRPNSDGRRIQDASLHAAQIGPLKSAFRAQSLLRKTRRPPELRYDCADGSLLEIRRLDMSSVRLHPEPSWWYVEAHKPTAYTPQFTALKALYEVILRIRMSGVLGSSGQISAGDRDGVCSCGAPHPISKRKERKK